MKLHLNQFDFQIEYRRTVGHQNADALGRFLLGEDELFDMKESAGDVDIVCAISILADQIEAPYPPALQKETAKDAIIPQVLCFTTEGWTQKNNDVDVQKYQKLANSLSTLHKCLLYSSRVVIPSAQAIS